MTELTKDWARWAPAAVVLCAAFIAWGTMQSDMRAMEHRIERIERVVEASGLAGGLAGGLVLQRLSTIETKIESLRESLGRRPEIKP